MRFGRASTAFKVNPAEQYRKTWEAKTTKQVEKELSSWQAHFAKHEGAYSWHGSMTAPGEMSDGDRVIILKDIIRERAA